MYRINSSLQEQKDPVNWIGKRFVASFERSPVVPQFSSTTFVPQRGIFPRSWVHLTNSGAQRGGASLDLAIRQMFK
jgi:hypothetical protein